MRTHLNQLEPQQLVDAFLKHPPQGFDVHNSPDFIPYFSTNFDLLTTLDAPVRQKIISIMGYRYWGKALHFSSCFVGTTVTEYSLLSNQLTAQQLIQQLKLRTKQHSLTIIKDLPVASPLLSAAENLYSQQLIDEAEQQGFLSVEGQALAYVPIDFIDREDYLSRLSKSRRKNLNRKLKSLAQLCIDIVATGDDHFLDATFRRQLYQLYLAVYAQSEVHFDLLSPEFFDAVLQDQHSAGKVICYWHDDVLVGYNICFVYQNNLVDKYIGFNYDLALKFSLYFVSWFVNLDYARQQGLQFYIAGWTDPEVKAQLGAKFTFTRHLVWIQQPVLRYVLGRFKYVFEADAHWREQKQES
ncbi:peptidoglycan biosynthesis/recognition protein [Acinetobacter calcoaceticus]|uniref:Peptidoglycan biosynthesis/recognition protein n=1 Tax=Acinetobacter calcoaceticus TaxID=471 RepID=A0A4R1X7R1_ACICA|nr:peptidoglycan biosynthesis/recognition protein [Acinetobacter calcoaceticus]